MAERRTVMEGSPLFWLFLKFVAMGPLLHLMFRPKVTGLEHIPREGGAIIASNHVSFLDGFLVSLVVPHRRVMYLTKVKYIDRPLLRWFLSGAGVVPVATGDLNAASNSINAAVQAVHDGRLIGIFPEGTRSPDGRLHRGKTGVARMAFASGAPVIPAGVIGTDLAFPRGSKLPRPHAVQIVFGPPITAAVPQGETTEPFQNNPAQNRALTEQIMTAIRELSGQELAEVSSGASGATGGSEASGA
jgi:1-acyl-sn-glycerol-3-phosphate acyltransferase